VAFEFGLVLDLNRFEDFGNSENLGLHNMFLKKHRKINEKTMPQRIS
jgi:hypothetical protein